MKYLKTFEDFVNESITNEAKTKSLDLSAKENVFAFAQTGKKETGKKS